jgi:hypothetical protein
MKFAINTILAALIIAGVTELSRRFSFLAALLVSLPLSSIIALSFVYIETKDVAKVSQLSTSIFWLVIPSLGFLLLIPLLLRQGMSFWLSLATSSVVLAFGYAGYAALLRRFGVSL